MQQDAPYAHCLASPAAAMPRSALRHVPQPCRDQGGILAATAEQARAAAAAAASQTQMYRMRQRLLVSMSALNEKIL